MSLTGRIALIAVTALAAAGAPVHGSPNAPKAVGEIREAYVPGELREAVERAFAERDLDALGELLVQLDEDDRASALRLRARLADRMGDPAQALELVERAIDVAAARPELLVDRAGYRARMIDGAGMLASISMARGLRDDLEQAIEIEPDHVDAIDALIAFHRRAPGIVGGDRARARTLHRRLERIDRARARFREAVTRARNDELAEAVEEVEAAIRINDRPPRAWFVQAARWLERLGRADEAVAWLERLLDESPDDPEALFELGRIGARHGTRLDRAVQALKRYLELPKWPNDPAPEIALLQLGRAFEQCGLAVAAADAFNRALDLDPEFGEARAALAALERGRGD